MTHSLIFFSGVTPANLLAVRFSAEGSLPHTCKQALVGFETGAIMQQTNALQTVLCRFGFIKVLNVCFLNTMKQDLFKICVFI